MRITETMPALKTVVAALDAYGYGMDAQALKLAEMLGQADEYRQATPAVVEELDAQTIVDTLTTLAGCKFYVMPPVWTIPAFRELMNAAVGAALTQSGPRPVRLTPHVEIVCQERMTSYRGDPDPFTEFYLIAPHTFTLDSGEVAPYPTEDAFSESDEENGRLYAEGWRIHDAVIADLLEKMLGGQGVVPEALKPRPQSAYDWHDAFDTVLHFG